MSPQTSQDATCLIPDLRGRGSAPRATAEVTEGSVLR